MSGRHSGVSAEAVHRHRLWARLDQAVAGLPSPPATPVLVVDLDAFDHNAADLVRRAGGKPIRLASKSVRVPALLRRALAVDGFSGVLGYTLREALWLEEQGVSDDIVVAYPTVDRAALAQLVASPTAAARITLMVDDVAHLDVVDSVRSSHAVPVRVALEVDAGLRLAGQHVGPKRSPLHDAEQVVALARAVQERPGFRLVGVMTYEGQVAGLPDSVPGQRGRSAAVRGLKAASTGQLPQRRRVVADALAGVLEAPLEFWNGGGTGSVETTVADPVVTEVAAGSGLLVPTLFDHYRSFTATPAAFFGVPVARRPSPDVVTVHGGGLVASGAAGPDRLPTPWAPPGLRLTTLEGAGEVQTPLTGPAASLLRIGDLVWFRHAKAGELFEHGSTVHLLAGEELVDEVATYRGHGLAF
ncbi:amino acid deaminase/aldolase [Nocardioides ferulae]|uniref:amino acid deaminase/aldolase n=1 Tax=Nocardioides ferulae TaxID=2340821 RepID=UPI000EB0797D|nr:amino acid deaminase/aldolase [Nocardioides ferulae]